MQEFSSVWLAGTGEEVAQAAAQVPCQLGLVRSKQRFGVRVQAEKHVEAFKLLRPTDALPAQVEVKSVYKLSGLPPGLRATDLGSAG